MTRVRKYALVVVTALALCLTACAPTLTAGMERAGGTVVITVTTTAPVFAATLSVLNASTVDERCVTLSTTDLGCVLGDLDVGDTVVIVNGSPGAVRCRVFAYTREDLSITSYRTVPCTVKGAS